MVAGNSNSTKGLCSVIWAAGSFPSGRKWWPRSFWSCYEWRGSFLIGFLGYAPLRNNPATLLNYDSRTSDLHSRSWNSIIALWSFHMIGFAIKAKNFDLDGSLYIGLSCRGPQAPRFFFTWLVRPEFDYYTFPPALSARFPYPQPLWSFPPVSSSTLPSLP